MWRHDTVAARGSIVARALSAHVVTVRAWSLDTAPSLTGSEFGQVRSFDESTEAVRRALVADTRVMLEHFPEVPVEYHVIHGRTTRSLVEISRDARPLVTGALKAGALVEHRRLRMVPVPR